MTKRKLSERPVIEAAIDINAPVEQVWQALTEADKLTNWFPLEARVKPGAGGSVWTSFRDACDFEGESRIEIWEPNRHLRLAHQPGLFDHQPQLLETDKASDSGQSAINEQPPALAGKPERVYMATDYILEGKGGTTSVRLIHSGFGPEADWDDLYEATIRGWEFQLRGLRHYLERHAGTQRVVVSASRDIRGSSVGPAWDMLTGPRGLSLAFADSQAPVGGAFTIKIDSRVLSGAMWGLKPPHDFYGALSNLNDAVIRASVEPPFFAGGSGVVQIWISTYGLGAETVMTLQAGLGRSLDALFGG